jgi:hypothetical protein
LLAARGQVIAQLTIPTGKPVNAVVNAQGRNELSASTAFSSHLDY